MRGGAFSCLAFGGVGGDYFSQDRDEGRGFRVFFLLAAGAKSSGARLMEMETSDIRC